MISARTRLVRTLVATSAAAVVTIGTVVGAQALAEPAPESPDAPGGQTAGSVYANRLVDPSTLISGAASGQQYSYWSQGSDEQLHLSTATLLEPRGSRPAAGWPVVVWAHGSDGWSASCAPSRNRDSGDRTAISRLLGDGYAVIAPDYAAVGAPGAPQYSDVNATAHNLVDAVRAAADIGQTDLSPKWAVVGQSQGAAAAVSLARNATRWQAGRLDFRGATATSIPAGYADLVAGLSPSSTAVPTPVVADVLYTLASQDSTDLEPILTERGSDLVQKAQTLCTEDLVKQVGGTQLADLVRKPLASNAKLAASLRKSLALPTIGFNRPILMSQRLVDESVVVPSSLRYLAEAQLASNKVTMSTYLTVDQSDGERQERAAVKAFLKRLY
ncbi:alpha/beta hydrolase [Gordonia hydrophobica]|uniref:Lipase family protein n=1 Tax=Gordonia hydrophobica TaxID=40516 RepID=A0ABZ2U2D0_9ACTN|nr:lipase family protein [Gordonia hydrophobica]MBM7366838.1 pimeloyl-ACP methyl ester carboxylesterase [Gordonia hydrophobica]